MAVIETWLHQDLQEPVKVNHLDGNLFSNNGNGNRIGVVLTNNGEDLASISGTVSGYVVTSDGSTVPCTGSKSGNRASILIPAAAYQPGSIFITVFVTDGTTVTTIGAVSTTVMRSRTNAQVDPGSAVTDWTQTINAAMQSVETAAANLGGIVAVPYASITFPVPLGKYTYYNNNLYRCITPIASSESFTAAHWTQVRLGDDVSDLKSALDTVEGIVELPLKMVGVGTTAYEYVTVIDGITLKNGVSYKLSAKGVETPLGAIYCYLKDSGGNTLAQVGINATTTQSNTTYTTSAAYLNAYIAIQITNAGYAGTKVEMTIEDVSSDNAIERIDGEIADIENDITDIGNQVDDLNDFAGGIAPNLLQNNLTTTTANKVTYTVNSDGTVTVSSDGAASATGALNMPITLPAGTYRISGVPSGASASGYHLRFTRGTIVRDLTEDYVIAFTEETSIILSIRVVSGTNIQTPVVFKPMVSLASYKGEYVQYGKSIIPETAQEMVNNALKDVDDITGYKKPNLFNNMMVSTSANNVTYTVNADKSVTVDSDGSSASAIGALTQSITLPTGKYLLNGCSGGSIQTYHLLLQRADSSLLYQYDGTDKAFEVTSETETMTLMVRVVSGATVDTIMYPMIRKADVYDPTYAPYGEYQIYKPIQELIDYTSFNWSGKKMNVIGDSIVQGSYGNFINVIRDILCLSEARNYGVGGSRLASSSADTDYPPAVLRYTSMDLDAQIIVVHAGTNDYSAQIPLGDPTSTDIETFNGALNVMMAGLRDMYPTALIIFDSILHRFNDGALTIKASQYRECIESRCLANHIVFYDCYRYSGFDFVKGYYDHILTVDGLHPNQAGADILGRKLAGFIRWN